MPDTIKRRRPPGYELFFAPLQVVYDPNTHERVQFAYFCSKYGHANQLRDDGTRYFDHPKGAAWIYMFELNGRDPEVIIDTLLHDVSEDSYLLSPRRISLNFGVETALDVRALTKLPKGKETTEEYLLRIISRGGRVILAKLLDRLHNDRDLAHCTPEKRERMLEETKQYHLRMLIPALAACGEPWSSFAPVMERLILEAMEKAAE